MHTDLRLERTRPVSSSVGSAGVASMPVLERRGSTRTSRSSLKWWPGASWSSGCGGRRKVRMGEREGVMVAKEGQGRGEGASGGLEGWLMDPDHRATQPHTRTHRASRASSPHLTHTHTPPTHLLRVDLRDEAPVHPRGLVDLRLEAYADPQAPLPEHIRQLRLGGDQHLQGMKASSTVYV
jgi:hypothetical protein